MSLSVVRVLGVATSGGMSAVFTAQPLLHSAVLVVCLGSGAHSLFWCWAGDVPLDGRREAIADFAGEAGPAGQPVLVCTDLAAR